MAEEKTNKALDDITGIVDNMGKIVTNANTIFAQLAESLSKTGVSFDTLSSDMAGVMPNILEVITAYDSVKGAVGLVTGGIGKAVETVGKLGQGMSKVPEIFSGIGSKIGPLKDSFSNFASALIIPIEDMIPKLANLAKKNRLYSPIYGRKDYIFRRRHRDKDCDKGWRTWEKID